ncbi:hypothetical protein AXF42_Ash011919 [Apostasia shenzhenica]|uniref:Nuclear pore complex protein NUP58 n=1 Tax=Apostasia shenzhenica TaxID=1088818 RepID=A0A2I0AW71_9ASPA|nr:hypothetical protein AXF42_Ash011919 [Apostasia shenzhenica]
MAFSFSSPSSLFQTSQTLALNPTAAQQQPFPSFSQPQPQLQPQQPQQPQQLQMYLFTADRSPAGYNTKFEDLHPDSQKFLLQIEERMLEYKDDSQRLEQCSQLCDSSMSSDSFELDASHILQELGGISTSMEREKVIVQELMSEVKKMIWNSEVAVRSYIILRPRFVRPNASSNPDISPTSSSPYQAASSTVVPVYDFYSGFPKRPSVYMQFTVTRFEKYLAECRQWIEELEQLVLLDSEKNSSNAGSLSLQSLPNIMSNVNDFFVHVAAKVESLHQHIESMKSAYLADQRRHGDGNDPFLEADRRETAKQEAAARRVHPTLHLPAVSAQPSTQGSGLFTSSTDPRTTAVQQTLGVSSAPSGSGFSLFGTPSSATAATTSSASLFSTPASAPASNLFGTGFSSQPTSSGMTSTSLFGSTQTPSLFGASTPSFTPSPAIGGSLLFSTPSLTPGVATGSGASFGAASKSARPKSRTARR